MTKVPERECRAYIANQILTARIQCGFSQVYVAGKMGVTFQQIQKYESGKNRISSEALYEMAEIMGRKIAFFYPSKDIERPVKVGKDVVILASGLSLLPKAKLKLMRQLLGLIVEPHKETEDEVKDD